MKPSEGQSNEQTPMNRRGFFLLSTVASALFLTQSGCEDSDVRKIRERGIERLRDLLEVRGTTVVIVDTGKENGDTVLVLFYGAGKESVRIPEGVERPQVGEEWTVALDEQNTPPLRLVQRVENQK